ncbi:MAG TPA: hypothetical protein VFE88_03250 [Candidatus Nanoarchaeia archaeon]|nr:hypothetical protein [Candidatus Nanoarchaeia archaeon]
MAEADPIIKEARIKYSGAFDLLLLYKKLEAWIKRQRFKSVKEVRYAERVKPLGKVVDITWMASKSEVDEYLRMELEVKFLIVGLNEVELDRPSGKIKLNKGDLELTFSSSLVRNGKNPPDWSDQSLFRRVYEKFIIADQIEKFKIELYKDTEKVMDETKGFLALYRFK